MTQKEFKVMASSMTATYAAGRFTAETPAEAVQKARDNYANSHLGRTMHDVGAFRFYVVDSFPYEDEQEA